MSEPLTPSKGDKVFVCRCEDVTLHEIEHAIELGHHDIESVKRFTGFGTGFCQGKQCVALCARVLTERTGKPALVPITPRPPFHPVRLSHLAAMLDDAPATSEAASSEAASPEATASEPTASAGPATPGGEEHA